jgi:hypothetical protein
MRIQTNPRGRARIYCASRVKGDIKCDCKGTFLDVYESQIEWYLERFEIPEDYQKKIMEAHAKLQAAYSDVEKEKASLERRLIRLKELYEWADIDKEEYQRKREALQRELRALGIPDNQEGVLSKLAHFLSHVADAWREANQEQRSKLAKTLFEEIWIEDNKVVVVKPKSNLEPFFKLNLGCHARDIASDPGGERGTCFKLFPPLLKGELNEGLKFWSRLDSNNLLVLDPYLIEELPCQPISLFLICLSPCLCHALKECS